MHVHGILPNPQVVIPLFTTLLRLHNSIIAPTVGINTSKPDAVLTALVGLHIAEHSTGVFELRHRAASPAGGCVDERRDLALIVDPDQIRPVIAVDVDQLHVGEVVLAVLALEDQAHELPGDLGLGGTGLALSAIAPAVELVVGDEAAVSLIRN